MNTEDHNDIKKEVRVSLRDYIDIRFKESQASIEKAEKAMNLRLESMNEFRSSMKDQAANFVTRAEANIKHDAMCKDIQALQKIADVAEGKASQSSMIFSYAISIISLVIAIASIVMRK